MTLSELLEQDRLLRHEADKLLADHGLLDILREYGNPTISGSYAMRVMTWRDLDIYLAMRDLKISSFLELCHRLAIAVSPRKASYTDHLNFPATEGIPGLYLGLHTGPLEEGGWKIDLWGASAEVCNERVAYCERLTAAMSEATRRNVLTIKNVVCHHPEYRKSVTSHDIYTAVLSAGVTSLEQFWSYQANPLAERG
jgi:hypothetical protein